ncbi:hypothetical protein GJ496_011986 [Pomphorhynchus laevis]|nr:hypothetical protein GJ496_011986 [Pomphorhynchus laevis]
MDDLTPPLRFSRFDPHRFKMACKSIAHCPLSRHTVVDFPELSFEPNSRLEPITRAISVDVQPDTVVISDTASDLLRAVSSGLNRVVEQPYGPSAMFRQRKRACQARCAVCFRLFAATKNGLLRKHESALGCPGSGQLAANGALPANNIGPYQYATDIYKAVDHINDCGEDDV